MDFFDEFLMIFKDISKNVLLISHALFCITNSLFLIVLDCLTIINYYLLFINLSKRVSTPDFILVNTQKKTDIGKLIRFTRNLKYVTTNYRLKIKKHIVFNIIIVPTLTNNFTV